MNYENVMKLALERGFYFPSCEVYGDAQAGFWEYVPTGVSIKNKFLELWRRELVRRDRMLEIDGSQIMSKSVFEASGHLGNFADPIIKCKKCVLTFRADKLISDVTSIEIPESAELEYFDKIIQEKQIVCTKCKGELNSNRDRHNHIGLGEIGKEGLGEIIKIMNNNKIPIVLETPTDEIRDDFENIKQAKKLV